MSAEDDLDATLRRDTFLGVKDGAKPLTKAALRTVVNTTAKQRFGVPADRLPESLTSGSTGESAAARRLAFVARYAKK